MNYNSRLSVVLSVITGTKHTLKSSNNVNKKKKEPIPIIICATADNYRVPLVSKESKNLNIPNYECI